MMRTPFFIAASDSRLMMLRVLSVSGVCSVMKSARRKQFVEFDLLDAEIERALVREIRIVGGDLHLQPDGAVGDDRADIAAADDAERLAEDFDAEKLVLLPLAGAGRGVGFGDLPGERQHQRDGVLGGGDRIAERRVHHDDAARGGGGNVDIVDADAGAADHFQVLGVFQDLRRHLGGGADGEAVEAADQFGELLLVLAERGLEIDLDAAILENLDRGGGERIGDENFRHRVSSFTLPCRGRVGP